MHKMETVIKVSNLTKFYGELLAVDHINFEVRRGEIFGFLGPNGAGKTTTIRMLTGLSRPTEGSATVLGYDVCTEVTQAKRHVGVVPENSNLYDEFTVLDNLLFMAQLYGVPRARRREKAEELLKIFGLSDRKDSPFRTLSRGMKRALTIAAALIHEPEILFLDEPTVGLDVVAARSLRNLIGQLRRRGITIFLTTHYLEEADLLCDRVAILVRGKILSVDSPGALKEAAEEESIIEFTFSGEIPGLIEELSRVKGDVRVVPVDFGKVRVYGGSPGDILEAVFRFVRGKGIEVLSVNSIKPSLEDAFIKITGLSPTIMAIEKGGR